MPKANSTQSRYQLSEARSTGRVRAVATPIQADFRTGNCLWAYLECAIDVMEVIHSSLEPMTVSWRGSAMVNSINTTGSSMNRGVHDLFFGRRGGVELGHDAP
jgi:hypothetical protein